MTAPTAEFKPEFWLQRGSPSESPEVKASIETAVEVVGAPEEEKSEAEIVGSEPEKSKQKPSKKDAKRKTIEFDLDEEGWEQYDF